MKEYVFFIDARNMVEISPALKSVTSVRVIDAGYPSQESQGYVTIHSPDLSSHLAEKMYPGGGVLAVVHGDSAKPIASVTRTFNEPLQKLSKLEVEYLGMPDEFGYRQNVSQTHGTLSRFVYVALTAE